MSQSATSWLRALLPALLLMGACAAPTPQAEPLPPSVAAERDRLLDLALDHWIAQVVRLQKIVQRIQIAGRDTCGPAIAPIMGAAILKASETHAPLADQIRKRFGERDVYYVIDVFPGMAADRSGLRAGDILVRIGSRKIDDARDFYAFPGKRKDSIPLEIERRGASLTLTVDPEFGCRNYAILLPSELINAAAVGSRAEYTSALLREVPDDSLLAVVVGHETAHFAAHRNTWARSLQEAVSWEEYADYLGIYLAAMAGYPIMPDAELYMRMHRNINYLNRQVTHPSGPARAAAFRKTLAEIAEKQEREEPLRPGSR